MTDLIDFQRIIDPADDAWTEIYLEAFPQVERRDIEDIKRLIVEEESFRIEYILHQGRKVGFISHWQLSDTLFGEHFAMDQAVRGQGLGGKALESFLKRIGKNPMMIEVEPPVESLATRRIKFYESYGFKLCERPYYQLPYRPSDEPLPLKLMTYNKEIEPSDTLIEELYRVVYCYESDRWQTHTGKFTIEI